MRVVHLWVRAAISALMIAGSSSAPAEDATAMIAERFSQSCPLPAPGREQEAYEACRAALFADTRLHALFSPKLRWGGDVAGKRLADLSLTHFDPRVFAGLYLPLFATTGHVVTAADPIEDRIAIKLQVRFRNQLTPGQFPYPFWHSPDKWSAYEYTNQIVFYFNRESGLIDVVLRSPEGSEDGLPPVQAAKPPAFDGQWVWSGQDSKPEPSISWFDGLLRADNPYLGEVTDRYRRFATGMRDASCLSCHVPSNPAGTRRLVLLQTPAHAAGEIKRVLASVRSGRMPREESGDPKPLEESLRQVLLSDGQAFSDAVDRALAWEDGR